MFEVEIHNFLKINQIAFEETFSFSIFKTYFLPQHKLYLHLISLQKFQKSNLDTHYFQNISKEQNAGGCRIIHLWEDVWVNHKEVVKARILAMIGIFNRLNARHCFVERIDNLTSANFLNDNHLQGSVKAKFKYGLFLKPQYTEKYLANNSNVKQLIAVATFSGGRLMKEGTRAGERSYELIRFASLRGYTVVGGMDKLLKSFESEHNPDDIMTYADRDWSDGRSYKILGFESIETTDPQLFMLENQTFKRYSIKENVGNLTKIFNAGSIKFIKKLP
jgi:hypothetical protein